MVIDSIKGRRNIQEIVRSEKLSRKKDEPLLTVDGSGFNREKVVPAQKVVKTPKEKPKSNTDDFYGRLRDMYNKPLITPAHEKKNPFQKLGSSDSIDSFATNIRRYLTKLPKETIEKSISSSSSEERVRYRRNKTDDVNCKTFRYEDPKGDSISRFNYDTEKLNSTFKGIEDDDKGSKAFEDKFPSLEDLPNDPVELEKVFEKYTRELESVVGSVGGRFRPSAQPGTEESVESCNYRLDPIELGQDLKEAVTGVRKCTCTDTVVIDGDVSTLKDIKEMVKELKTNHNVGAVEVKMKEAKHSVNEKIKESSQLRDYTGPVLLTSYALQKLCSQISKHPCLDSLVFRHVPLPASYQAALVPAYANLSTLKMVGVGLRDSGVSRMCNFLWRSENLKILDLTDNGITAKGVEKIAKLIDKKGFFRSMQSKSAAIERLTLNKNPIGKEGCKTLMAVLEYDLFMKAVDLRECDIELTAKEVLDQVGNNTDLNVLDLRGNRIQRLDQVIKSILQNCPIDKTKYKWDDEEEIKRYL